MKPFLVLASRPEDAVADAEFAAFVRFSGLAEDDFVRIRMEQAPLPSIRLADYSGAILGGSPFTASIPVEDKSPVQRRVEEELFALLDEVVARDFPLLGACYGVGTLGTHQGGIVDDTYRESVGPTRITLTDDGLDDPLFGALPPEFEAFLGHKEAITKLPAHAAHLARSDACPVQAFRIGRNVYATQFHPELDVAGTHLRIDIYKNAGYFPPETAQDLKDLVSASSVVHPPTLLRRFVELYARD